MGGEPAVPRSSEDPGPSSGRPAVPGPRDAVAVDGLCQAFETAWRAGQRPRIEEYLEAVPTAARDALLYELVALERELRADRGEAVLPLAYRLRFPADGPVIDAAFRLSLPGGGPLESTDPDGLPPVAPDPRPESTVLIGTPGWDEAGPAPRGLAPAPGSQRFGPYELLEEIAHGGMGVVYRARQVGLNRVVALKMILSGRYATEAERSRFLREAHAAAALDHVNIVPIYEVGQAAGHPYFTMKLIDGQSLASRLREFRRDPRGTARLLATVARAVHYAHSRHRLVHRDLKPANILVDAEGRPHVTDFGLAKRMGDDSGLTESGAILGTASYMAPEQAAGHANRLNGAADIYSLGAVLYELLTGRPPFQTPTVMETIVQVLELDPVAPRQLDATVPRPLERICLKCLEKSPERRYGTAEALAEDLDRFLRGEEVEADRGGWRHAARRWVRREPELACHLGTFALVAALTEWNRWWNPPGPRPIPYGAIQALFAVWAAASLLFQALLRRTRRRDGVRLAWTAADLTILSAILHLRGAADTSLVVGYTAIIAAVGLWSRVGLVWAATAISVAAYAVVYGLARLDHSIRPDHRFPNVVFAALLVTGFAVAHQVRRFWALSTYYENRPQP